MKVPVDALQARIIGILRDWYPITVEELRDELSLPSGVLERSLKALMVKGVIALEPLSDKTFIRLLTPDLVLEKDGKGHKKTVPKPGPKGQSVDDIMYR
jgi:hypothetical protein